MKNQVQEVLNTIKPMLQGDGGDVELVEVDEATGIVKVKLTGACQGCPMAGITLKQGIEKTLKEKVDGVKEVVAV